MPELDTEAKTQIARLIMQLLVKYNDLNTLEATELLLNCFIHTCMLAAVTKTDAIALANHFFDILSENDWAEQIEKMRE